jgi:hypothetical protein
MHLIWQVLEGAKDAGDAEVLAAARRLVRANMLGWGKHAQPADYEPVKAFAELRSGGAGRLSHAGTTLMTIMDIRSVYAAALCLSGYSALACMAPLGMLPC